VSEDCFVIVVRDWEYGDFNEFSGVATKVCAVESIGVRETWAEGVGLGKHRWGGGEDDGCLEVRKVSDFKYEPNVDCVQK